jgi:hypothetical protein
MSVGLRRIWIFGAWLSVGCPADDSSAGDEAGATGSTTSSEPATVGDTAATDASTGPSLVETDYATDIQPIWNDGCNCHLQGPSGMMLAAVLTLNEGMSFAELTAMSEQAPMPRVSPSDLDRSYLWHKLHGTHLDAGGMGTSMPQVGTLSDEQLALIEAWILGGAQP